MGMVKQERSQALNLALMYQRQQEKTLSDDDILRIAKRFSNFLDGKDDE